MNRLSRWPHFCLLLFCLLFVCCAAKKGPKPKQPYPFENGKFPANIALLGHPDRKSAEGLRECLGRYEGLALLTESRIYAELRNQQLTLKKLIEAKNVLDLPRLTGIQYLIVLDSTTEQTILHVYDVPSRKLRRFKSGRVPTKCEKLLTAIGFVRITSDPPGVDSWVDGQYIGRTPLYTPMTEGSHSVELFHPEHMFDKKNVFLPADEEVHFMRQNVQGVDGDEGEKESKTGLWMMTIGGIIVGAGMIFLPIWLFLL